MKYIKETSPFNDPKEWRKKHSTDYRVDETHHLERITHPLYFDTIFLAPRAYYSGVYKLINWWRKGEDTPHFMWTQEIIEDGVQDIQ